MIDLGDVRRQIETDPSHWVVYLMDFVDDFRYHKNPAAVARPFKRADDRFDALLASVAEYLCDELGIKIPDWLGQVPACKEPWFISGVENLKAIAIVESPLRFRIRKIFVLENFLSRA
ncbi:MAG: hypothetical protein HYR55_09710 [Acidobacteria bacterium]|nr:hypothetical protein [Acidobacteriota bacterium]MBI3656759.1 hypothetical protein [Acidobacteriota bacterium]